MQSTADIQRGILDDHHCRRNRFNSSGRTTNESKAIGGSATVREVQIDP